MTVRIENLRSRTVVRRGDLVRFLPSMILAGYGIFILSLFGRHALTMYINPAYVWPTTLAGVVLVGLAAIGSRRAYRLGASTDSCCATASCGCSPAGGCDAPSPRVWPYVALFIPLFLAIVFPPRSLAAFSARQRGTQIAGLSTIRGASTVNRISLSVDTRAFKFQDWVGALSSDPNPNDYLGKAVQLSGLVVHNPSSVPPGFIMVLRYQVTCCIADARPVGLIVRDTSHGTLKDNQWVSLFGKMGKTTYQGTQMPVIEPQVMRPTKAGDPYMY